ncbi:S8 family peptidase [Romboutsia lituseburensis]|uniref:Subtilase family protein n=1 Tax=Romboutsia lituseburensis DSM 797 TaxID=1121325 RepID=A0A1G9KEY5_9FIRM|nr:S8 family serine peptidase [Romboutsia lituseburensis]CEH34872.1 Serine proteases, subtilase family, aspartic acid active site [Romboutsia lituseburensis]SDL47925.1 Subtilase family protein [Romboutsia lituseburensis DSM 797]
MNENLNLTPFTVESEVNKLDYTIPYGVTMLNATEAWKKGYTGKGVVVAIIDTGCDTKHPALEGRIIGGRNFTSDDNSNPDIFDDYQGHGTHVAGTIAANTTPVGITGVAPRSKFINIKGIG